MVCFGVLMTAKHFLRCCAFAHRTVVPLNHKLQGLIGGQYEWTKRIATHQPRSWHNLLRISEPGATRTIASLNEAIVFVASSSELLELQEQYFKCALCLSRSFAVSFARGTPRECFLYSSSMLLR